MPLPAELEQLLVCPRCRGELAFPRDRDEVHCLHCQLAFPVVDGIPVMLVREARPLAGAGTGAR